MKKFLLSALFLTVCGFATAARASTITFLATGDGSTASGSLTATETAPGVFQVTGITGDVNGYAITGLSSFKGADNFVYLNAPYVDGNGLSFVLGDLSLDVNLYYNNGYMSYTTGGGAASALSSFELTAAPEPSSVMLVGSGLLGVAGCVRRRIVAA